MSKEQDDLTVVYLWAKEEAKDEIKALRAENERLREALHRIQHSPNGPKVYCCDGHEEAVLIARAALGKGKAFEDRWDNA